MTQFLYYSIIAFTSEGNVQSTPVMRISSSVVTSLHTSECLNCSVKFQSKVGGETQESRN